MGREGGFMTQTQKRLRDAFALLERIDRTREETHNPQFGENAEKLLIGAHLRDLEAEILLDPGALAPLLAPPREEE
jgi:hypothetical protein